MKRVSLLVIVMIAIPALLMADGKKKKTTSGKPESNHAAPVAAEEIHWITSIDELQAKMAQNPKKVYMDVYTGWCGWCKKMDADVFRNPDLIKYMNNNFYAVKLDAERQDVIHFQGKEYKFEPQYKANTFAVEMMHGSMSYPTSVFMVENFQSPTPIPGYHTVKEMEIFMSYFGDNAYKHVKWEDYQKTYHPSWDHGQAPDMTPPPGHGMAPSPPGN
jgi:thioredoxin-related protein